MSTPKIVLSGDTSGAISIVVPDVAGTNTITIPAKTGTMMLNTTSGSIIQVQSAQVVGGSSASSPTSYTSVGLAVTITPTAIGNTLIGNFNEFFAIQSGSSNGRIDYKVALTGPSSSDVFTTLYFGHDGTTPSILETRGTGMFTFTVASLSAHTFTLYVRSAGGSGASECGTIYWGQYAGNDTNAITIMEVAA